MQEEILDLVKQLTELKVDFAAIKRECHALHKLGYALLAMQLPVGVEAGSHIWQYLGLPTPPQGAAVTAPPRPTITDPVNPDTPTT